MWRRRIYSDKIPERNGSVVIALSLGRTDSFLRKAEEFRHEESYSGSMRDNPGVLRCACAERGSARADW
jgi:hypothetical protein